LIEDTKVGLHGVPKKDGLRKLKNSVTKIYAFESWCLHEWCSWYVLIHAVVSDAKQYKLLPLDLYLNATSGHRL